MRNCNIINVNETSELQSRLPHGYADRYNIRQLCDEVIVAICQHNYIVLRWLHTRLRLIETKQTNIRDYFLELFAKGNYR